MILNLIRHPLLFAAVMGVIFWALQWLVRKAAIQLGFDPPATTRRDWLVTLALLAAIGFAGQLCFGIASAYPTLARTLLLSVIGSLIGQLASRMIPFVVLWKALIFGAIAGTLGGIAFSPVMHSLAEGPARALVVALYGLAVVLAITLPLPEPEEPPLRIVGGERLSQPLPAITPVRATIGPSAGRVASPSSRAPRTRRRR